MKDGCINGSMIIEIFVKEIDNGVVITRKIMSE